MKQFSKELGKVSITPKGNWDSSIANERLDIVYDKRNNQAYIAKQDVPIGVDIDNREYWQPLNVSGYADNNFINLTAENENGTITAYESLEEAVATIFPINRRAGATLSFYNLNSDRLDRQAEFELWQFNSTDLANWENKDYWNNIYYNWNVFAGWYIDADALNNHVNVPNVGQYAYVGSNLNDAVLYQCRTNGTWTNTGIKVRNYISVVVSGNITIGENGNWFSDGEDTGIPATPSVDEQLDNIIAKHESLSRTVQGIAATGGASTATNVTYNNDASGLNAENAQDAIDELQGSKIDKTSILQELGNAEDKVMSQVAVKTELDKKADNTAVEAETKRAQSAEQEIIYDVSALKKNFYELDEKSVFAIDYKTDNSTTRLQVPKSSRKTGKIISYRNSISGELTVEMYLGTSVDDQYWQDDLFWANIFPSTKLPFINVTFITNKTYSEPDNARNALPNTYYKKEGLIFSFKDNNNRYRSYLYLGQVKGIHSYIPIDNYCFEVLAYNTDATNTRYKVDFISRKQGFTITYNDGTNQIIETYIGTLYDNSNWGKDSNWQRLLTYKDFDEILANNANIYNTIAEFSINKVYSDLILSNKAIDNAGNVISGAGYTIDAIEIPSDKKSIYTNAYSLYFYSGTKDNLTFLSKIIAISGGVDIRIKEIPEGATYVKGWYINEKDFYYLSFDENFIPVEFGITEIPKIDYNKNLIIEDNLIKGYNNVNGSLEANELYNTTRFIPIDSNVKSIFSNAYSVSIYGEDGAWINYTGTQSNTFREIKIDITPKFLVLSFSTSVNPFASIFYFPCNNVYEIVNGALNRDRAIELAFKGKKFCSFGDSIVELSSWQKYIWKYFKMADHYIRGIGGSKVTNVNPQTKKVNEDGYYNASNPDSGTITISDYMCGDERVNTIPLDTDVLCIYASANDITASVEMGTLDDGDESHFMYAYGSMVRKIVKRLPKAKIFLCTPHNFNNSYSNADYPYKNTKGLTILDYCKAIKDIGAIYGIPVIDVNALSTISTLTITEDLIDQVHPAPTGGKKIANVVISEMIRYVSMSLIEPIIEDVYH